MKESQNNEIIKKNNINLSKSQKENVDNNSRNTQIMNRNKYQIAETNINLPEINSEEQIIKIDKIEQQGIYQKKSTTNALNNDKELGLYSNAKINANLFKEENELNIEKEGDNTKINYKNERVQISYEKNEFVLIIDELNSQFKKKKEKIKPNKYKLVDINDPDLFDGTIKFAKLKCILFGILISFLNSFRLVYLIFLHLIYPIILWAVKCIFATCGFCCICCLMCEKKEVLYDSETNKERFDSGESGCQIFCNSCKSCGQAFTNCFKNFIYSPCWFYEFILDCLYDIKNRALDNSRIGCYRFLHNDCGLYEKYVEDPFNDYNKKRSIILSAHPNDPHVLYGDACQNNIKI